MNFALLRNSLRMRLLAGTLVWIVISILVAGWGLGQLFHHDLFVFHSAPPAPRPALSLIYKGDYKTWKR